jgi:hypothetical protein
VWETIVGITGIYSGVGGRGEPAERGEFTAEEAAGMMCAKCELRESLEKKASCSLDLLGARWQERWRRRESLEKKVVRPRLYLNYLVYSEAGPVLPFAWCGLVYI